MKHDNHGFGRKLEKLVLFLVIAGFLAFFALLTVRLVNATSNNRNVRYYQISPLPSFTPSPAAPTDTPTQIPPTSTDTATPTQIPPTSTDTATPTQIPPTSTDTATPTPTPIPPTPTDTPIPNSPPTIEDVTGNEAPVAVNEEVTISVFFSDLDEDDSHEGCIDWGDGIRTCRGVNPDSGIITVVTTDTHRYAGAGIFSIVATVTDSAGATDTWDEEELINVYDPDGGFVTGGGWIDSLPGAYKPDPSRKGKVNFGFVSKYSKGKSTPGGKTTFIFKAGGLNFKSVSYEWFVISHNGSTAMYKGNGTINGNMAPYGRPYKFMIWAADSTPDTFRIKIWHEEADGEAIVYDNGVSQPIQGGNIMIHKGKK